ncbi:MAG: SRPBCC family protein [Opitutaceae bacterium]
MIQRLHRDQVVRGDPGRIWEFFASPYNLDTLTPASLSFRILGEVAPRMYPGQMIEYRVGVLPGVTTRWLTEITHVREGSFFVDEQRIGPYRLWHHEHHFTSIPGGGGVRMVDLVTYEVGWGPLGDLLHALWIRRQLKAIFDFRTRRIEELFPSTGSIQPNHATRAAP